MPSKVTPKRKSGEKLWCILIGPNNCYAKEPREAWDKIVARLKKAVNEKPGKHLRTKSMKLLLVSDCGVK